MATIAFIDARLTQSTEYFFLAIGLWGLFRAIRGAGLDGGYTGALVIGQGLFVILLIFDVVLWFGGIIPQRAWLNYLYDIFAVLLLPYIYFTVLNGDESNRAQWIFTFVTLFLFGIADRAMTTSF